MATGKQIRHYRQKLKWTLKDLEKASGVEVGTISALEQRDSRRSEFFEAIAKAFTLTVTQMADDSVDWPVIDRRFDNLPLPTYTATPLLAKQEDSAKLRLQTEFKIMQITNVLHKLDMEQLETALRVLSTLFAPNALRQPSDYVKSNQPTQTTTRKTT